MNKEAIKQVMHHVPRADMTHSPKPWLKLYLNASDIDWAGKLPLTRTGTIDHQKAADMGMHGISGMRPLPVIQKESDKYRELTAAVCVAEQAIKPATSAEAGFELKRLSVWCPMPSRDKMDFKMMLHDALTDLSGFPHDLIQKSCALYRNDPDRRNDFFPRPGRLKVLVEDDLKQRKVHFYRLKRLLEIANEPPKLPPPPLLSDFISRAENQLASEKMIAEMLHKKYPVRSALEEREEILKRAKIKADEAFANGHMTEFEFKAMEQEFYDKFPAIFNK